jgi:transformation/transcription domain-associated protein
MSRNVTAARLSTTGQKISDCHVEADEKLDEQTLHCLIGTLFQASTDEDVGADALKYLKAIYIFACKNILEACSRSAPSPSVLSEIRQSTLLPASRGLSPGRHLATLKRIDAIKEAMYGKVHIASSGSTCNFSTLQRAIISALCSSDEEVAQNGKLAIKWIIDTHVEHYKSSREAVQHGGALFNQFCELCCHSCYDKSSWRNKLGGIYGLLTLVDLLDPCWTHENLLIIMKALFFVLTDHPIEITAMISSYTGKTMLKALEKSWEAKQSNSSGCDSNSEKIKIDFQKCAAFQETELFQMFVVELFSPKTSSRRYAKKCISKFASLSNSTPSSLLFPYHQLIGKQIMGTNLRLLPVGTRTGYIDAMAYSLSLNPPIFSLNKDVLMFLQDVWGIISDDNTTTLSSPALSTHPLSGIPSKVGDTGNNGDMGSNVASASSPVSAQEYPFGMSQVCEMRIAAVKLLRAAFLAGPDEINQHHEARNRFVGVFFRYLTGQTLELVLCAQEALTDVIHLNKHNKDISLPKELLQQCLRPVLLNLADYRKLNIPLLDGLSRLLSLLSSCFNVTLGEKLLEHLKQWRDPERIMKAGIWKRGEEPAVAASIIDLFHLLPPNDSFLEPLINCVVELEAVLPRYGSFGKMSSPYRIPLTKFLNRYASLTVGFFFKKEHLIDKNYSLLFQELIKIPEAGPIRAVLTGDGGSEAIMTATFIAASKLGSYVADLKSGDSTDDSKIQAQIQLNAQKAAAQAVAAAQAQGMSASSAEARGIQARAAYVAKAQAQINAQHAVKTQSQIQIQANAQKIHAQTLVTAQAQGLSLVQAQAKAQHASKEYITKAQSLTSGSIQVPLSSASSSTLVSQQQALHAQIQANAQKVHAQALAAAQAQGLKPIQAQEKAKQAQATYVHRAKAQAQAKLARAQSQNAGSVAHSGQKFHQEALELHYQGLRLVRSISKIHPGWLGSQIGLIDCLKKLWRSSARIQRLLANDRLPIRYHMESKLMIKCFINYSRAKQDDVQILLDMLSVFLHKTSFDFSFLQCYYGEEVAVSFSSSNKRNIIRLFLRMLHEPNASEELKVYAIQMLVVPILTKTFEDPDVDNSEVLDSETIMWMLKEILASKEYPLDSMQILRIELLKLGTLLIQHMSKYVTDHRKEVIKFAWNHLKAPDLTAKLWGYVNVCRFISVYETPPKIVLQVYVALLRTHEMDSRFLVRKAFDVLLPALPNRLPSNEFIKAIKWTKKIVYEEGHVLGQLVHIWFLIVRHPALFYPFRSQFVPLMVNSLNRLAIPPSSTPDNRRLAVNIVDLIVSWEHTRRKRIESRKMYETVDECKRLEECNKGKRMMPSDHDEDKSHSILKKRKVNEDSRINVTIESKELGQEDSLTAIKSDVRYSNCEDDFELNSVMVDLVVNFAFRFALASADKQETSRLSKTCGDLFNKALLLWPSASIRFSYFDKLIAVTAEVLVRQQNNKPNGVASSAASHTASIPPFFTVPKGAPLASLAILNAVLGILNTLICSEVVEKSSRSIPYVIQYTPRIMKLLEPCFDRNNSEIQSSLSIFIKRMVKVSFNKILS